MTSRPGLMHIEYKNGRFDDEAAGSPQSLYYFKKPTCHPWNFSFLAVLALVVPLTLLQEDGIADFESPNV